MHYDSDEAVDLRRITAILYLNPGWAPEHGAVRALPMGVEAGTGTCQSE